jgi:putative aminopeptidase FrvX
MDLLRDDIATLTQLFGPSGHEDTVIAEFLAHIRKLGFNTTADRLGNVVVRARPAEPGWPTLAVSAHLDEVGFIVSEVGNGWVRVNRVGGVHDQVMAGQLLEFRTTGGEIMQGHVSVNSAHLSTPDALGSAIRVEDAHVDLLIRSVEELVQAGLSPGVPAVFAGPFHQRGSLVRAKALDDRAGLAVILALLRSVPDLPPGPGLTVIATVQEEFALRAGITAAAAAKPDILICIDITPTASIAADAGQQLLGAGPVLQRYSRGKSGGGLIPNPRLAGYITSVAAAHGIPLIQHTLDGGLTDGSYMQYAAGGIPVIDLTFGVRNAHTAIEVADLQDLAMLVRLLGRLMASLQQDSDFARG